MWPFVTYILINSYEDMYPLLKQEAAEKAIQLRIRYVCTYCCVRVNPVRYMVVNFRGYQFSWLLSMKFYMHGV